MAWVALKTAVSIVVGRTNLATMFLEFVTWAVILVTETGYVMKVSYDVLFVARSCVS